MLGFVHVKTQRTGVVIDGPFGSYDHDGPRDENGRKQYIPNTVEFSVLWDDTGMNDDVLAHEIKWINESDRHITDGVRVCHCGPSNIEGVIIHKANYELN